MRVAPAAAQSFSLRRLGGTAVSVLIGPVDARARNETMEDGVGDAAVEWRFGCLVSGVWCWRLFAYC